MAINVDLDRADAEHFLRSYPANFPIVFDPQRSLAEHFKVKAMPTSELFDRHGTLRFTHIGFLPRDRGEYEQQVRSLLAEK